MTDETLPDLLQSDVAEEEQEAKVHAATAELAEQNEKLRRLSDETRLVVSEPLGELEGAWQAVPESSYGVIQKGADEQRAFRSLAVFAAGFAALLAHPGLAGLPVITETTGDPGQMARDVASLKRLRAVG